ncbi:hypothetical protein DRH14_05245 [Candidatus Shapirobacteria bacterium]|nr:MAG: hypothetical protein DRH14_05245 [Candidatus Shapirobacteria bacterium]
MDITLNNQMTGTDCTFSNTETFAASEVDDNFQKIAAAAVGVSLDFGHVTSPTYFKMTASVPVHLTM